MKKQIKALQELIEIQKQTIELLKKQVEIEKQNNNNNNKQFYPHYPFINPYIKYPYTPITYEVTSGTSIDDFNIKS